MKIIDYVHTHTRSVYPLYKLRLNKHNITTNNASKRRLIDSHYNKSIQK